MAKKSQDLTNAERNALNLVCRGMSNRDIGKKLGISPKTVKTHLYRVYKKMGVKSRTQAMVKHFSGRVR